MSPVSAPAQKLVDGFVWNGIGVDVFSATVEGRNLCLVLPNRPNDEGSVAWLGLLSHLAVKNTSRCAADAWVLEVPPGLLPRADAVFALAFNTTDEADFSSQAALLAGDEGARLAWCIQVAQAFLSLHTQMPPLILPGLGLESIHLEPGTQQAKLWCMGAQVSEHDNPDNEIAWKVLSPRSRQNSGAGSSRLCVATATDDQVGGTAAKRLGSFSNTAEAQLQLLGHTAAELHNRLPAHMIQGDIAATENGDFKLANRSPSRAKASSRLSFESSSQSGALAAASTFTQVSSRRSSGQVDLAPSPSASAQSASPPAWQGSASGNAAMAPPITPPPPEQQPAPAALNSPLRPGTTQAMAAVLHSRLSDVPDGSSAARASRGSPQDGVGQGSDSGVTPHRHVGQRSGLARRPSRLSITSGSQSFSGVATAIDPAIQAANASLPHALPPHALGAVIAVDRQLQLADLEAMGPTGAALTARRPARRSNSRLSLSRGASYSQLDIEGLIMGGEAPSGPLLPTSPSDATVAALQHPAEAPISPRSLRRPVSWSTSRLGSAGQVALPASISHVGTAAMSAVRAVDGQLDADTAGKPLPTAASMPLRRVVRRESSRLSNTSNASSSWSGVAVQQPHLSEIRLAHASGDPDVAAQGPMRMPLRRVVRRDSSRLSNASNASDRDGVSPKPATLEMFAAVSEKNAHSPEDRSPEHCRTAAVEALSAADSSRPPARAVHIDDSKEHAVAATRPQPKRVMSARLVAQQLLSDPDAIRDEGGSNLLRRLSSMLDLPSSDTDSAMAGIPIMRVSATSGLPMVSHLSADEMPSAPIIFAGSPSNPFPRPAGSGPRSASGRISRVNSRLSQTLYDCIEVESELPEPDHSSAKTRAVAAVLQAEQKDISDPDAAVSVSSASIQRRAVSRRASCLSLNSGPLVDAFALPPALLQVVSDTAQQLGDPTGEAGASPRRRPLQRRDSRMAITSQASGEPADAMPGNTGSRRSVGDTLLAVLQAEHMQASDPDAAVSASATPRRLMTRRFSCLSLGSGYGAGLTDAPALQPALMHIVSSNVLQLGDPAGEAATTTRRTVQRRDSRLCLANAEASSISGRLIQTNVARMAAVGGVSAVLQAEQEASDPDAAVSVSSAPRRALARRNSCLSISSTHSGDPGEGLPPALPAALLQVVSNTAQQLGDPTGEAGASPRRRPAQRRDSRMAITSQASGEPADATPGVTGSRRSVGDTLLAVLQAEHMQASDPDAAVSASATPRRMLTRRSSCLSYSSIQSGEASGTLPPAQPAALLQVVSDTAQQLGDPTGEAGASPRRRPLQRRDSRLAVTSQASGEPAAAQPVATAPLLAGVQTDMGQMLTDPEGEAVAKTTRRPVQRNASRLSMTFQSSMAPAATDQQAPAPAASAATQPVAPPPVLAEVQADMGQKLADPDGEAAAKMTRRPVQRNASRLSRTSQSSIASAATDEQVPAPAAQIVRNLEAALADNIDYAIPPMSQGPPSRLSNRAHGPPSRNSSRLSMVSASSNAHPDNSWQEVAAEIRSAADVVVDVPLVARVRSSTATPSLLEHMQNDAGIEAAVSSSGPPSIGQAGRRSGSRLRQASFINDPQTYDKQTTNSSIGDVEPDAYSEPSIPAGGENLVERMHRASLLIPAPAIKSRSSFTTSGRLRTSGSQLPPSLGEALQRVSFCNSTAQSVGPRSLPAQNSMQTTVTSDDVDALSPAVSRGGSLTRHGGSMNGTSNGPVSSLQSRQGSESRRSSPIAGAAPSSAQAGAAAAAAQAARQQLVAILRTGQHEAVLQHSALLLAAGSTMSQASLVPEVRKGGCQHTTASDVFSFGVLAYQLLSGSALDTGREQLAVQLSSGWRPAQPPNLDAGLWRIIISCWKEDPASRPSMSQVVERLVASQARLQPQTATMAAPTITRKASADEAVSTSTLTSTHTSDQTTAAVPPTAKAQPEIQAEPPNKAAPKLVSDSVAHHQLSVEREMKASAGCRCTIM